MTVALPWDNVRDMEPESIELCGNRWNQRSRCWEPTEAIDAQDYYGTGDCSLSVLVTELPTSKRRAENGLSAAYPQVMHRADFGVFRCRIRHLLRTIEKLSRAER